MATYFSLFHGDVAQGMGLGEESLAIAAEIGEAVGADTPLPALGAVAASAETLTDRRNAWKKRTRCFGGSATRSRTLRPERPKCSPICPGLPYARVISHGRVASRKRSLGQQRELGYTMGVSDTLFHLALISYQDVPVVVSSVRVFR